MKNLIKRIFRRKVKIVINYKSGRQLILRADNIKARCILDSDDIRSISWEGLTKPKQIFKLGLEEIESMYEI